MVRRRLIPREKKALAGVAIVFAIAAVTVGLCYWNNSRVAGIAPNQQIADKLWEAIQALGTRVDEAVAYDKETRGMVNTHTTRLDDSAAKAKSLEADIKIQGKKVEDVFAGQNQTRDLVNVYTKKVDDHETRIGHVEEAQKANPAVLKAMQDKIDEYKKPIETVPLIQSKVSELDTRVKDVETTNKSLGDKLAVLLSPSPANAADADKAPPPPACKRLPNGKCEQQAGLNPPQGGPASGSEACDERCRAAIALRVCGTDPTQWPSFASSNTDEVERQAGETCPTKKAKPQVPQTLAQITPTGTADLCEKYGGVRKRGVCSPR